MNTHFTKHSLLFFLISYFNFQATIAQNTRGKIIDLDNGESIPFASILVNTNENLVSSTDGYFTLSEKNSVASTIITISYMGYASQTLTVEELNRNQNIIMLQQGIIELNELKLSDKKLSALEIMTQVKANVNSNYKNEGKPTKNMIFFRETNQLNPSILEVAIDKSSGFSKAGLKKANQQLAVFLTKLLTQPPKEFTDILSNYYTSKTKKGDKFLYTTKLEVIKAAKLKNENSSVSLDELQKSATTIMLTHLDSTKFYRIKSGLFGSRDTISLRKDYNKKKNKNKQSQLNSTKMNLSTFLYENSMLNKTKFDFIHDLELYEYSYEGAKYSSENEFVSIISFKPKRSKAKYTGKLFISETDFAVLRVDYNLAEGKKVSGFNMKFLLGVKSMENISNGKIIFKRNPNGNDYFIHYASKETGQYIYVNRPLKFIELTDKEKDIVAFDLKVEANTKEKIEFLNINQSEVTETTIEKYAEEDFKYIKLKSYDPKIWKDYISIEPLEEMRQFKSLE